MAFPDQLRTTAAHVEAQLAKLLNQQHAAVESMRPPDRLAAAMRQSVLGGGKRIRPFLMMQSAALFDVPFEQSVGTAAALECLHCYSLVHDDLPAMDDDDLRRGKPTVHKAFDEWTAILAGDALQSLAFEILAQPHTHADPAIRIELVALLARRSGWCGMAGGQQLDLDADAGIDVAGDAGAAADHDQEKHALSIAEIERLQAMKTGALIRFACEAGAILGRADRAGRNALGDYGSNLGRAFQIADDLLDAEGDFETVGKAVGKDAAAGKATLVSLMGIDAARKVLSDVEAAAIAALSPFGPEADVLRDAAHHIANRRS